MELVVFSFLFLLFILLFLYMFIRLLICLGKKGILKGDDIFFITSSPWEYNFYHKKRGE